MSDDSTTQCLLFPGIFRKPVVAQFDQRDGSPDGGALLLKAADRRLGLLDAGGRESFWRNIAFTQAMQGYSDHLRNCVIASVDLTSGLAVIHSDENNHLLTPDQSLHEVTNKRRKLAP